MAAGSAQEFKVSAERFDGFEGPIRLDFAGVPPGFRVASPLVIEAGQLEAFGVVVANEDAASTPVDASKGVSITATATAEVDGREVTTDVNPLGSIKLGPAPKFRVAIAPVEGGAKPIENALDGPIEFALEAGQSILLKVVVDRVDFQGQVPFGNEGAGRNLPFGTIVDNLGLNGLLVLEGQRERSFSVTADPSTPEQTRLFHLTTAAGGGVSSRPVRLRITRPKREAERASDLEPVKPVAETIRSLVELRFPGFGAFGRQSMLHDSRGHESIPCAPAGPMATRVQEADRWSRNTRTHAQSRQITFAESVPGSQRSHRRRSPRRFSASKSSRPALI